MNKIIKSAKKKFKLSLKAWYSLPFFIRKLISQKLIKRNNNQLFNVLKQIILKNQSDGVLVIGANDGFSFDELIPRIIQFQFKHKMIRSSFFVEPIPYYYQKLVQNLGKFNCDDIYSICYNVALHPENPFEEIFMVNPQYIEDNSLPDWLAGSSSFSYDLLVRKNNLEPSQILTLKVKCNNFHQVINQINIDKKNENSVNCISYLQIDTEGFDDQVLEMIDFSKIKIDVIKFEKTHFSATKISELRSRLSEYYSCLDFGEDEVCFRI